MVRAALFSSSAQIPVLFPEKESINVNAVNLAERLAAPTDPITVSVADSFANSSYILSIARARIGCWGTAPIIPLLTSHSNFVLASPV